MRARKRRRFRKGPGGSRTGLDPPSEPSAVRGRLDERWCRPPGTTRRAAAQSSLKKKAALATRPKSREETPKKCSDTLCKRLLIVPAHALFANIDRNLPEPGFEGRATVEVWAVQHTSNRQDVLPPGYVELDVQQGTTVNRDIVTVYPGDDLQQVTKRAVYADYLVQNIGCKSGEEYIELSNQEKPLRLGEAIGDVDGDARRDQGGGAGRELNRGIDAGTQIETGGASRRVGWQILARRFAQYLELNLHEQRKDDRGLGSGLEHARFEIVPL